MQFKRVKKNINGILLLDKPLGFSSNQALQRVKWLLQAAKAGHTGTLDPLATGLLPLCFGEATKFAHYLTDADKTYHATIKLGITTTTGDAEGEVLQQMPVQVSAAQFRQACLRFIGTIQQVPPMYSALKHEGKALYEYAREGIEIERKVRTVNIHNIEVLSFAGDVAEITVTCSKGTYIRTLAEDIGASLGCGAHLIGLRRTYTAGYDIAQAVTLAQFEAMTAEERLAILAAPDSAVDDLPAIVLDADSAFYLMQGQAVWQSGKVPAGLLRLYDERQVFLGLGEQQSDGKIAPKRLMQQVNN
ncbi:tRNA pseudouridine(55) synthase TruB [Methylotenera mobilis]|uniref:tRNA pseudouridine synthase B n=1 Tax=Methylotenera mobilis (strain JLW8 / ATCC BAA-1282 / DSM 17540) TaxID=583345 RepID=C6WSN1_METML|nr:tRNA pseudouridine(55) synthase TruB [Methylotenera mobilis]ACT47123.1 tRNA pseudouridine synthase B [Methylotenera mobilis JLW8]